MQYYPDPYQATTPAMSDIGSSTALHLPSSLLNSPYYSQPPTPVYAQSPAPGTYASGYPQDYVGWGGGTPANESEDGRLKD
jgi:hypothetical protein